jgi:hypothetical protein
MFVTKLESISPLLGNLQIEQSVLHLPRWEETETSKDKRQVTMDRLRLRLTSTLPVPYPINLDDKINNKFIFVLHSSFWNSDSRYQGGGGVEREIVQLY